MIDPVSILTLIGTGVLLVTQLFQIIGTGKFKSSCCDGCMTIEHSEKNDEIHIDISKDISSD